MCNVLTPRSPDGEYAMHQISLLTVLLCVQCNSRIAIDSIKMEHIDSPIRGISKSFSKIDQSHLSSGRNIKCKIF